MTDIYFKYIINNNVLCCMDSPYTTSYPFHIQPSSIIQLLNNGGSYIFKKKKCIFIRKTKRILACLSKCVQSLGHVKFLGVSKACIFQSLCILLSNSLNVHMSRSPCFPLALLDGIVLLKCAIVESSAISSECLKTRHYLTARKDITEEYAICLWA